MNIEVQIVERPTAQPIIDAVIQRYGSPRPTRHALNRAPFTRELLKQIVEATRGNPQKLTFTMEELSDLVGRHRVQVIACVRRLLDSRLLGSYKHMVGGTRRYFLNYSALDQITEIVGQEVQ